MQLLRGDGGPLRVGHRGAAALAPENSLAAIEAAARAGADAVELDVARGLVIAHSDERVDGAPTLDEALELAAGLGLAVQIDVKEPGLAAGTTAALRRHGLEARSFVSAPSARILREFAAADPALPRSLTYPEDRHGVSGRPLAAPFVRAALAAGRAALPRRLPRLLGSAEASAATLDHRVVSRAAVDTCHRLGAAVLVWTVNDPGVARALAQTGVDGIITDDPGIVPAGPPNT